MSRESDSDEDHFMQLYKRLEGDSGEDFMQWYKRLEEDSGEHFMQWYKRLERDSDRDHLIQWYKRLERDSDQDHFIPGYYGGRENIRCYLDKENDLDPDEGNSMLCSACMLPIFSTPFIKTDSDSVLHDQCANDLPKELVASSLHSGWKLVLCKMQDFNFPSTCNKCESACGSMFYKCHVQDCSFKLDVKCAGIIKILHRSHEHRLMPFRSSVPFTCSACGTQHYHQPGRHLLYFCNACDFWIHPDCASLPNAINLPNSHTHDLLLTYALPSYKYDPCCGICKRNIRKRLGVYFCNSCHYYAHIRCAVKDPQSFKPVLIRDARVPQLLHFPVADEETSLMPYIIENTSGGGSINHQSEGGLFLDKHEHPLFYHVDNDDQSRVCNGCVGSISPPFYSCSQCTNFFLHSCCLHLPDTLPKDSSYLRDQPLHLVTKAESSISTFLCARCKCYCNGFAYSNLFDSKLCVVCAFMPPLITHDAHGRGHILYLYVSSWEEGEKCLCCDNIVWTKFSYKCGACRNFNLDIRCATLPNTIRHRFDQHPLKLTKISKLPPSIMTSTDGYSQNKLQFFCEVCEEDIETTRWCYSCDTCDQYFHINCIPSLVSKIKLGVTVHVQCHDCPLTSVRAITIDGYRCDYCENIIRGYSKLAFECSECYFRIHEECVKKCLKEIL